jgi:cytochrome c oxidase subunit II
MSRLAWSLLAAAALCGPAGYYAAQAAGAERIVVSAKKFSFDKQEIRVKKGRPVTLVLSSSDFEHGFSVPDFNVRADFVPGKTVELTFTPDRAGRFEFLCDNFCGEGHDGMSGFLVVTED